MFEETENNEMIVDTNNGAQNQMPENKERFKRPVIREVINGELSIPKAIALESVYGKDVVDAYKGVLKDSKKFEDSNNANRRKSLINLSVLARQKDNPSTPAGGGTTQEIPQPEENKKDDRENETEKEYYLRILQRRLELIENKYGIKFDQELIDFFKSDEYFENGNIDFLENADSFGKVDDVWNDKDLLNDSAEVINKVEEDNKNAMEIVKSNALKYGDSSLYSSVASNCEELEKFIDKTKKEAAEDDKFYNEQKSKDRVERAILAMAVKNNENDKIKALGEVLIESINKRANYMKDEIEINNYRRNLIMKEENAKTLEEIKIVKESEDKLVLLQEERRRKRPNTFVPREDENKEERKETNLETPMDINSPTLDNFKSEEKTESVKENENAKKLVLTFNKPNQSNVV